MKFAREKERIVYGCFEESSCESNELNLLFMLMTIIYLLLLCLSQSVAFNSHFLVVILSWLEMNRNELNRSKVNSFELGLKFKFKFKLKFEVDFDSESASGSGSGCGCECESDCEYIWNIMLDFICIDLSKSLSCRLFLLLLLPVPLPTLLLLLLVTIFLFSYWCYEASACLSIFRQSLTRLLNLCLA